MFFNGAFGMSPWCETTTKDGGWYDVITDKTEMLVREWLWENDEGS